QIGRQPRGKTLETLLRDAAARGIRPHPGNAIVEIRGSLADRRGRHQGMAGSTVLAAPWRRRTASGGSRLGLGRRAWRWRGLAAFGDGTREDVVEEAQRAA